MPDTLDYIRLNLEGIMATAGLIGETEWRSEDRELIATVWMSFDAVSEAEAEERIQSFTLAIFEPDAVEGVTFTSASRTVDGGKIYILHVFTDDDLENSLQDGKLNQLVQNLSERFSYELRQRRAKRKREELPDPSQSPKAAVNAEPLRNTFKIGARVSQDALSAVDRIRDLTGKSKREVLEEAIFLLEKSLDDEGPSI